MPSATVSDGSSTISSTPHIPAWKRLGLRLKFAKDTTEANLSPRSSNNEFLPVAVAEGQKKRKRESRAIDLTTSPTKKSKNGTVKTSSHSSQAATTTTATATAIGSASMTTFTSLNCSPSIVHKGQKSVSFTPQTKVKDGDSVKQLFAAYLSEQKAEDPTFDPSAVTSPALTISTAPVVHPSTSEAITAHSSTLTPKPPKRKKEKKPKLAPKVERTESIVSQPADYISPHLRYLTSHHTAP